MEPDEYEVEVREIAGFGEPGNNPVPRLKQFGGKLDEEPTGKVDNKDHGPNMMEFDIKTSTDQALNFLKQKNEESPEMGNGVATNNEEMIEENFRENNSINPDDTEFSYHSSTKSNRMGAPVQNLILRENTQFQSEFIDTPNQNNHHVLADGINSSLFASNIQSPTRMAFGSPSHNGGNLDPESIERQQKYDQRESERMRTLYEKSVGERLTRRKNNKIRRRG